MGESKGDKLPKATNLIERCELFNNENDVLAYYLGFVDE